MSRYIVFSMLLGFITFVTSLPMNINSLDDDTFDKIVSGLQSTNEFQDNSDWQNMFQVHNSTEPYTNLHEAKELFYSNNFDAVRRKDTNGHVFNYISGKRILGDRLVSRQSKCNKLNPPRDVYLTIRYPDKGQGKKVTRIEIVVDQSSIYGKATRLEGGIGQHVIKIFVEAKQTYRFNYIVQVFGI